MSQARIAIPLARIKLWFLIVTPSLALLGFASEVADHLFDFSKRDTLVRLFNMVMECNIPNWYASALLLACAGLLTAIVLATPPGKGAYRGHWLALALIFVYISIDETVQLHELINRPLRHTFDLGGMLYYAWVIPACAIVAVLAVAYWRFLGALSAPTRRLFVLAAVVYVGGALGTEFFVNHWVSIYGTDPVYGMLNIVQETMELSGLAVFFVALLGYLQETFGELRVVVE
ncbi:MAG: hypothetical protein HN394_24065 [Rhodospirillaceae bacterium]|jgi:hypothetical protein|nr:hypothetical protein [Rhodospirillaceae bacterium]MBT3533403.1 hypothetical protein [Rhodospirillaceae bacterium]MBT4041963.1 hypothetical protein [Rhodospirillaceae bacterium]MBT4487405.1 hypothetical protein [Rhodospirillaceae bacterium]MBT5193584.1 hypothetical protein [Rhodospirillaceae bacterium]